MVPWVLFYDIIHLMHSGNSFVFYLVKCLENAGIAAHSFLDLQFDACKPQGDLYLTGLTAGVECFCCKMHMIPM